VAEITKYRDAWAASKQVSLAQVFQASAQVAREISRGGMELDRLMQQLGHSTSFSEFYAGVEKLAEVSRSISYNVHNLKLVCDLQTPPASVYTDHFVNQFFLMSTLRRTWWVEGPIFCTLAFEQGDRVLEIGCGTGYFTDIFFSPFAAEIIAIDIDSRAIETARRMHTAKNIRYEVMDARKELPAGHFDAVVWTPSITAYTPNELDIFMEKLHNSMSPNARLCGWTFLEADRAGPDILWHDMNSLAQRLKGYFKNVRVIEHVHPTIEPPRYVWPFYASNGRLPLDADWPHAVTL